MNQPEAMVPTTSKTPMTASSEAAAVTGMPWSWAAGTKWVWMRPLVEAPQMAKVPASSQKGPVRTADSRTPTARRAAPGTGGGLGYEGAGAVGGEAHVGGVVAEQQPDEGDDGERGERDGDGGGPPVVLLDHPGQQRQEDELAGGGRGGEDAADEASAPGEPPVGDGRGERECHGAGAEADEDAPAQQELPGCRHPHGEAGAEGDDREGGGDDAADAEPVHEGGGERGGEAVQREVHGDGGADGAAGPAVLLVQRVDEQAGQGTEGCRADDRDERDGGDEPRAVDTGPPLRGGGGGGSGIGCLSHAFELRVRARHDRVARRTAFARIGPRLSCGGRGEVA
ncbi:hypothetical protein GCM10020256_43620 [Streptomyces thermocoprophilus]